MKEYNTKEVIASLIDSECITNQTQLTKRFFDLTGETITQASISRYIKELDIVKVFDKQINKQKYIQAQKYNNYIKIIDGIIGELNDLKYKMGDNNGNEKI